MIEIATLYQKSVKNSEVEKPCNMYIDHCLYSTVLCFVLVLAGSGVRAPALNAMNVQLLDGFHSNHSWENLGEALGWKTFGIEIADKIS